MPDLRDKRRADEVLFKWDSKKSTTVNFEPLSDLEEQSRKRREYEASNPISLLNVVSESELTNSFHKSTVNGLLSDHEYSTKGVDKRCEMLESIRTFQLNTCKDWLGSNNKINSLRKIDTLDRLSCLIINTEGSVRSEVLLYTFQMGKCNFDFYNLLYSTKLWQLSNLPILQLTKQPLPIRNKLIISIENHVKCSCPIGTIHKLKAKTDTYSMTHKYDKSLEDVTLSSLYKELSKNKLNFMKDPNRDDIEDEDERMNILENMVCRDHIGRDMPELFNAGNGGGILEDYNLLYKYDELKISNRNYNVLTFYNLLGSENKIWQYRLLSKLVSIRCINLKDYELERNIIEDEKYLCNLYRGKGLFIATRKEIMIGMVYFNNKLNALKLGIVLRDSYKDVEIKDVVCHKFSGRIFILTTNNLLYEYCYQYGLSNIRRKGISIINHLVYQGKNFIKKLLYSDKVYKLQGTITAGYYGDDSGYTNRYWWDSSGNCLDDLNLNPSENVTLYWPPIIWKELHVSIHESIYNNCIYNNEVCDCTSDLKCKSYKLNCNLNLINPWNKSYFNIFSGNTKSKLYIDEKRWYVLILTEGGDLYIYVLQSVYNFKDYMEDSLPFNIVEYSIKSHDIKNTLSKFGYFKYINSYSALNIVNYVVPSTNLDGVDAILLDSFGTRIYVGFVHSSNGKTSLAVKGFRLSLDLLYRHLNTNFSSVRSESSSFTSVGSEKSSLTSPSVSLKSATGTLSFTSSWDEFFLSFSINFKTDVYKIGKMVISSNDDTSFCQLTDLQPKSIQDELWFYNQLRFKSKKVTTSSINQPVEYYDFFYFKLTLNEDIIGLIHLKEKFILVTTHKIYTFIIIKLTNILKSLVKNPINTIHVINPPPIIINNKPISMSKLSSTGRSVPLAVEASDYLPVKGKATPGDRDDNKDVTSGGIPAADLREVKGEVNKGADGRTYGDEHIYNVTFIDIFSDEHGVELCNEDIRLRMIGNGLYYLSWLYTCEDVYAILWKMLLHEDDMNFNIIRDMLISIDDDYNLFLSSLGIPSKLYGCVIPGYYSYTDNGGIELPIINPWCKFINTNKFNTSIRINKINTNLTSTAIDGLILLVYEFIKPFWINSTFIAIPNNNIYYWDNLHHNYIIDPINQINDTNQFMIGGKYTTELLLKLSLNTSTVEDILENSYKLYQLLTTVLDNYEKVNLNTIIHKLYKLPINIQAELYNDGSYDNTYSVFNINNIPTRSNESPPEVSPAVSSSNYLSLKSIATPGDRGGREDVTSSGLPAADLREAEGQLNRRSRLQDRERTSNRSQGRTYGTTSIDVNYSRLERWVMDRYEMDIRVLRELVYILEVFQEYLSCCLIMNENCVIGDEVKYEFDKLLENVILLPTKSHDFFTVNDLQYKPNIPTDYNKLLIHPFSITSHNIKHCIAFSKQLFNIIVNSNFLNLCYNKEFFKIFKIATWLTTGNITNLHKHFFGHIFTFDELEIMSNCNRIKYLERQYENNKDNIAISEYIKSLTKLLAKSTN